MSICESCGSTVVKRRRFRTAWRRWVAEKEADLGGGRISATRYRELSSYESRGWLDELLEVDIGLARRQHLVRWVRALGSRVAPSTVKKVLADVGTFFRFLEEEGAIPKAPGLPKVQVPEYAPRIPGSEDVDRVLGRLPSAARGIMLVRCFMGLRPAEARRLTISCLKPSLEAPEWLEIPSTATKTGRVRRLELHPRVLHWLQENVQQNPSLKPWDTLFTNPNTGGEWTEASLRRALVKATREAGVEWTRPNEMGRHFFATNAVNSGADIYAVQDWLGHSSPVTTQRYAKLRPVPLARVMGSKQ